MRLDLIRLVLGLAALAIVVAGAAKVIYPFVDPILWAMILGSATWPAYRRLRGWFGGREALAATTMTLVLVLLVVIPVVFLGISMVREVQPTIDQLQEWADSGHVEMPAWAKQVPGLEDFTRPWLERLTDRKVREAWLRQAVWPAEKVVRWSRNILRQLAAIGLTIFALFFVYRDGETAAHELGLLLDKIAGASGRSVLHAVRQTVRAVFYGWLLTAAAQGIVAMFGYWVAGLRAPVLLGIATGLAAVIPFGVGLVWIPAVGTLVASGEWGRAIFLAIWSLGFVGVIDNFLRPLFISGPSRVPFVLVFFGIMGGIVVYGFLGLVLGPVFLAILLALWRQSRDVIEEKAVEAATG
jgi:predicted PurR-regulated permease PerM